MPTVTSIMFDLKKHPMLAHRRGAGGIESRDITEDRLGGVSDVQKYKNTV